MSQSAYIKFVEGSAVSSLSLDELKDLLLKYKDQLTLTGQQLDWEYGDKGFPYTIEIKPEGEGKWFMLKATNGYYKYILAGVGSESAGESGEQSFVQITLPDGATSGDKSKANEFCKHLAKQLKAELHLFNKRVMYYNPRK
ncbi:DUF1885 family protein [Gorillibacterium sp. sgz5001074]|uniref:DUF1885 family protein n=1 Tax=Gorillibacterium sp. sgz5001074 TaxID=3446695 RepID=UPI003F668126